MNYYMQFICNKLPFSLVTTHIVDGNSRTNEGDKARQYKVQERLRQDIRHQKGKDRSNDRYSQYVQIDFLQVFSDGQTNHSTQHQQACGEAAL